MHIFKDYTAQGIDVRLILAGSSCISGWFEGDEHFVNAKFRFSGQNNIVPMYSEQKGVVESLSNSSDNVFLMVDWEILQSEYTYFITNSKALSEKKHWKTYIWSNIKNRRRILSILVLYGLNLWHNDELQQKSGLSLKCTSLSLPI